MRQHFYTLDGAERKNAIDTFSFKDEGVACPLYQSPSSGPVPLYRSMAKSGAFLYTTDITERDTATTAGEVGQGIACYVMPEADRSHIPLRRAYNPATGDHFYTPRENDFNNAVQQLGYVDEGVTGFVVPGIGQGLVPLYWLVKKFNFYTTDAQERDHAIKKLGFTDMGILCGVEAGPAPGPQPLYRSLHSKTGAHFYTMSITERDEAVNKKGHRGEGITGNLFSAAQPDHIALLRAYKKADDDYFYTTDQAEMANATGHLKYKDQIVTGYVPAGTIAGTSPLFRLYGPKAAKLIAFSEQFQTQTDWCWSATTVSIAHFYDARSPWTQCNLANQQMKRTDCCSDPSGPKCNKPWYLDRSLKEVGHLAKHDDSNLSLDGLADEICATRPLGVRIGWYGGGGHFPVISGFDLDTGTGTIITIDDPIFGPTTMDFEQFPSHYQSGGHWTDSYKTKP